MSCHTRINAHALLARFALAGLVIAMAAVYIFLFNLVDSPRWFNAAETQRHADLCDGNNRFLAAALDDASVKLYHAAPIPDKRAHDDGDKQSDTVAAMSAAEARALIDVVIPLDASGFDALEAWRDALAPFHCILVVQKDVRNLTFNVPAWLDFELYHQSTLLDSLPAEHAATFLRPLEGSKALGALLSTKRFVYALDPRTNPGVAGGARVVVEHASNLASRASPLYFLNPDDADDGQLVALAGDLGSATAVSQGLVSFHPDYVTSTTRSSDAAPATVPAGAFYSSDALNLAFAIDLAGPLPMFACGECAPGVGEALLGWAVKTVVDHLRLGVKRGRPVVIFAGNASDSQPSSRRSPSFTNAMTPHELQCALALFNGARLTATTAEGAARELALRIWAMDSLPGEMRWTASALEATAKAWTLWRSQRPAPVKRGKPASPAVVSHANGLVTAPTCDGVDAEGNACHIPYVINGTTTTFNGMATMQERNDFYDKHVYRCGMMGPPQTGLAPQPHRRGVVLFTAISNCYDPLPRVSDAHLAHHRIAFVDNRTAQALQRKRDRKAPPWELFILDPWPEYIWTPPFMSEVFKSLAARLFPNAQWALYADGKASISLTKLLTYVQQSDKAVFTSHHDDRPSSALEFARTRDVLILRNASRRAIDDLDRHWNVYRNELYFPQTLWLSVPDIVVVMVKPSDKNAQRFLCAWFNEIAFLSMRGQLSFLYPLHRLNLMAIYTPFPQGMVRYKGHRRIC